MPEHVGDAAGFYIFLHLVQPLLIALIAYGLWLLVDGFESRAATVVRYAVIPYAIVYAMFDAIAGVATGLIVREANGMSAADQAAVQRMMDGIGEHPVLVAMWIGAGLSWLVPAAALAVREQVPRWVTAAMIFGASLFAVGHPVTARPDRHGAVPARDRLAGAASAGSACPGGGSAGPELTAA